MPNPQLKSYSEKYNVPLKKVEEFWDTAKEQYGEDWEAVSGTVKKMCQNYRKGKDNMNETSYEKGLDDSKPIIVKGVKGMKSKPFIKKFKNMAAYEKWTDSDDFSDYEVRQVMNETLTESNINKALRILREGKVPTYSKAKIKQMIKDGKCEVNTGDIETVRPGSHIELRMFPSKKVKTVQVESIQVNEDVFAEIAELTSDNQHSDALVRGAEYVAEIADGNDLRKAEGFVETFKMISKNHKRAGSLTPQLSAERSNASKDFFKFAKKVLSPEDFQKLNKSY